VHGPLQRPWLRRLARSTGWWVTAAAVACTMVEQFLPAALKAVAIVLLAGGVAASAYLAWTVKHGDSRKGDDR
jgi:hypothetical protein